MRLSLLVLALLSTTELFGHRFHYAGSLQSRSFRLLAGSLTKPVTWPQAQIYLYRGVDERDKGRIIFDYTFYVQGASIEILKLKMARWMIDFSTLDIVQAIGDDKGKVIGQRLGTVTEDNLLGSPFTIETDDTMLKLDAQYDAGEQTVTIRVSGEKTLEDGQTIKWEDKLTSQKLILQ